jgi:hypothetical protein
MGLDNGEGVARQALWIGHSYQFTTETHINMYITFYANFDLFMIIRLSMSSDILKGQAHQQDKVLI